MPSWALFLLTAVCLLSGDGRLRWLGSLGAVLVVLAAVG